MARVPERDGGARPQVPPEPVHEISPTESFSHTRVDLERWAKGDHEALDRLWRRYGFGLQVFITERLKTILNRSIRNRLERDDILHDVFVTMLRDLDAFAYRGPGSLLGWMKSIAARRILYWVDYWEAGKRNPAVERSLDDSRAAAALGFDLRDPEPGPATSAARMDEHQRLVEAVAELPEREKRIVILTRCETPRKEIAELLGVSERTVRREYARILSALGRKIDRT